MSSSDGDVSGGSSDHNMDIPEAPDITNKMKHYNTKVINANKTKDGVDKRGNVV
jgi:hypothetical protein